MINVHLNGDLVRCPNISESHKLLAEIKDSHRICRYNYHEDQCSSWQSSLKNWQNIKDNGCSGRCNLSGSVICPGHIKKTELGNKEKCFSINNQVYRKMASASHYLVKESEFCVLFICLTFPQFKKKISYNEINKYFSKFVHNLRENYNCGGYIGVREFGKKSHRVHFHLAISLPFVDFRVLNDSWCNCIKDICGYSSNALTSDKKTLFIRSPGRAMRYVCKYFAKCKGQNSKSRLVFISNNLLFYHTDKIINYDKDCEPIYEQKSLIQKAIYGISIEDILKGYKGIYINRTSDYTTLFRITDKKDFARFCKAFLYPLFELSDRKNEYLYSFPESPP